MNGIVLEFGRKMRAPEKEEEGVVSYTKLYGIKGGARALLLVLTITFVLAMLAARFAQHGTTVMLVLVAAFLLAGAPGLAFLRSPTEGRSKWIERASAGWTIPMYLSIGGITMLTKLFAA